ncbi:MAG: thiamine pyrophosphate-dependent dehydrogenase E1 component subunit alpha [Candidatus Dormibacteria bacterium]
MSNDHGRLALAATERAADPGGLDDDTLRTAYTHMVRSRLLDERIWLLNRLGRARFWVSAMGHEALQVGLGMALRPGHDWVAPYYRDLALSLVVGMTPRDHLLAALARADDPNCGSRQMPAHYSSRRLQIISTGSCVATQLPHAAGVALASKMRGEDAVTVTTVGDGGTSEGDFHEALNFAAIHTLPLVCVVENNGLAISVPLRKQMPPVDIAEKARAYGIPGVTVDGGDVVASLLVCREAVERARRGEGPTLIDGRVQRLADHSSDDDQKRYRSSADIDADKRSDCLIRERATLEESGVLRPGDAEEIRAAVMRELDRALDEAEAAPMAAADTAHRHVYGE